MDLITRYQLQIVREKVSESRTKDSRYPFLEKIKDLKELINNSRTVEEQEFYEIQLKKV